MKLKNILLISAGVIIGVPAMLIVAALVFGDPPPDAKTSQVPAQQATTAPAPAPGPAYQEIKHGVNSTALDAYADARIVPTVSTPEGIRAALQAAHDAYWDKLPVGSDGHRISRFQAWAYSSVESDQRGEAHIGYCDHMDPNQPMTITVK